MTSLPRLASLFACASITMSAATPLSAQSNTSPRADLLVGVEWLEAHLNDPNLVLLHVGDEEDYAAEHIEGAHYVHHRAISHPGSHSDDALTLELPEPETLQATLRRFGISENSRIVVYWGSEWVTPTARVVFTLDWAGLGDRTVLLDGGLDAWKAAGLPVTDAATDPGAGDVVVRPRDDMVVMAEWVEAHTDEPGYALVDARARAFYDGVRGDRDMAGHIPGAGSVPWTELIDDHLRLKPAAQLREVFAQAGVAPTDTVVAYCHIGQYATMALFAARTLGHHVLLYDGAFQDWARRDLPVTTARR